MIQHKQIMRDVSETLDVSGDRVRKLAEAHVKMTPASIA